MRDLLATGIPGLDHILGGGIPHGYSWLVEGENGIGKTTLALQFVHAIHTRPDERAMYITFIELPEELQFFARNFGWDLEALEQEGRLKLLATSPEILLTELLGGGGSLRHMLEDMMPTRLVIDAVTDLRLYLESRRDFRTMLEALLNLFRRRKVTTLLLQDTGPDNPPSGLIRRVSDLNILMQRQTDGTGSLSNRVLEVTKVRGQAHYNSTVLFEITPGGVLVLPPDFEVQPRAALDTACRIQPSRWAPGFSTGFVDLDELLGGGLPNQSNWLFTYDENSYYPDLLIPLFTQAIADDASIFLLRSGRHSFEEARLILVPFGYSLEQMVEDRRVLIGDLFEQSVPPALQGAVASATPELSAGDYAAVIGQRLRALVQEQPQRPHLSVVFADALARKFGNSGLVHFTEQLLGAVAHPSLVNVFVTTRHELGPPEESFLTFMARGVVHYWKHEGYQYVQIAKTPRNTSSAPCLMTRIPEYPFFKLLVRR